MSLPNVQFWLAFQIVLEGVIVVFMVVFFLRLRRLGASKLQAPKDIEDSFNHFVTVSQKLSTHLSDNLKQKKDLSLNLLLKLERKINEMNQLLEKAEQGLAKSAQARDFTLSSSKNNPAAPESRALVLKLAAKGLDVGDIARQARLHRGEVELILDLEKQLEL